MAQKLDIGFGGTTFGHAVVSMREVLEQRIDQALDRSPADLIIRNTRILDLVTGDLRAGDIAICGEHIVGTVDRYGAKMKSTRKGALLFQDSLIATYIAKARSLFPANSTAACFRVARPPQFVTRMKSVMFSGRKGSSSFWTVHYRQRWIFACSCLHAYLLPIWKHPEPALMSAI
jgi:hypothetical protein